MRIRKVDNSKNRKPQYREPQTVNQNTVNPSQTKKLKSEPPRNAINRSEKVPNHRLEHFAFVKVHFAPVIYLFALVWSISHR
ncbi:hypothetical protein DMA11_24625 [Marinilabiliaceae bacterium JC017]|nr:hypothetical protein DMA11_24625 [Marinilabiliaceae bacterium JC017]